MVGSGRVPYGNTVLLLHLRGLCDLCDLWCMRLGPPVHMHIGNSPLKSRNKRGAGLCGRSLRPFPPAYPTQNGSTRSISSAFDPISLPVRLVGFSNVMDIRQKDVCPD